jgi:hypothetical protein
VRIVAVLTESKIRRVRTYKFHIVCYLNYPLSRFLVAICVEPSETVDKCADENKNTSLDQGNSCGAGAVGGAEVVEDSSVASTFRRTKISPVTGKKPGEGVNSPQL